MNRVRLLAFAVLALLVSATGAQAAGTPVGTVISNQASATYEDSTGNTYNALSNLVQITVEQVYSVTITPLTATDQGVAGGIVYYAHEVQNTGNGGDSFSFSSSDSQAGFTSTIYEDVNGNGILEGGEPVLASPFALAADATVRIIVAVQIPPAPLASNDTTVLVTSVGDNTQTATATDTTNISTGPVLNVTLSHAPATVNPLDILTLTATADNNAGVDDADNVVLVQAVPANTVLQTGTTVVGGTYGGTFTVEYDDGSNTWALGDSASATQVRVTLTQVGGDIPVSGTVTLAFDVQVQTTAPAGTPGVTQTATVDYTNTAAVAQTPDSATNDITVNQAAAVTLTNDTGPSQSTLPGTAADYVYTIINTGNGTDTFDLTVNAVPGFTVELLDGALNPIVASPALAAGASYSFTVRVTPNANAADTTLAAGAVHTVVATSQFNNTVNDSDTATTTADRNTLVTVSSAAPSLTGVVGGTIVYTVTVTNDGDAPDAFDLAVSDVGGTYAGATNPWNYVLSAVQTAVLAPGASENITVTVTVPADADPNIPDTDIIRVAATPVYDDNGVPDATNFVDLTSTVQANFAHTLTVVGPANLDAVSGGFATYQLDLANTGDADDSYDLSVAASSQGWTWTFYLDNDLSGTVNAGDTNVSATPVAVAAGGTVRLLARITVPAVIPPVQDISDIAATSVAVPANVATVTLTTSVGAPSISLNKSYVLTDTDGSGGPTPGDTVTYTITYTNTSTTTDALNVVISDAVPAFTTYVANSLTLNGAPQTDASDSPTDEGEVVGGNVQVTVGTVPFGASGDVSFSVLIQ